MHSFSVRRAQKVKEFVILSDEELKGLLCQNVSILLRSFKFDQERKFRVLCTSAMRNGGTLETI